jgi:hypothetical protein
MDVLLIFVNFPICEGRLSWGGPAPNSRHRVTITPAKRNKAKKALLTGQEKNTATKTPIDDLGAKT